MCLIMIIFADATAMRRDCCPVTSKQIVFADDKRDYSYEGNLHFLKQ